MQARASVPGAVRPREHDGSRPGRPPRWRRRAAHRSGRGEARNLRPLRVADRIVIALDLRNAPQHCGVRMPRSLQHGYDRERNGESDAGQDPEHEHAGERGDGEGEVAAVDPQEPAECRQVDQPQDRCDHDRREGCDGDVLEQPCAEDQDGPDSSGSDDARQLRPSPCRLGNRRPGRAARDREALEEARGKVRGREPTELAALIDPYHRAAMRSCGRGRSYRRTRAAQSQQR